jgi:hypothetical protein
MPSPERPARTSSHGLPQTTRLNDQTKRQGRAGQTSCTNVHKANLGSQHSIFYTGLFVGRPANEFTRTSTRTTLSNKFSSHRRPQTTRPNDFAWAPERPKRSDKGEPGKRAARTCTKPTSGHNLAFLIQAHSPECALARTIRMFTRAPSNDPPERFQHGRLKRPKRSDKGEPGKRAARTCTKPTSGHNLAFLIRARSLGCALARTTRPNAVTRTPSNDPPERPK